MAKANRGRVKSDEYDHGEVLAELVKFVEASKDEEHDWRGRSYGKLDKKQAINQNSLEPFTPILTILMRHLPNGMPRHKALTLTFVALNKKMNVYRCEKRDVEHTASKAAGFFRVMLGHVMKLSVSTKGDAAVSSHHPMLRKLVKKVKTNTLDIDDDDDVSEVADGEKDGARDGAASEVGDGARARDPCTPEYAPPSTGKDVRAPSSSSTGKNVCPPNGKFRERVHSMSKQNQDAAD